MVHVDWVVELSIGLFRIGRRPVLRCVVGVWVVIVEVDLHLVG